MNIRTVCGGLVTLSLVMLPPARAAIRSRRTTRHQTFPGGRSSSDDSSMTSALRQPCSPCRRTAPANARSPSRPRARSTPSRTGRRTAGTSSSTASSRTGPMRSTSSMPMVRTSIRSIHARRAGPARPRTRPSLPGRPTERRSHSRGASARSAPSRGGVDRGRRHRHGRPRRVRRDSGHAAEPSHQSRGPVGPWAPDGRRIAFTRLNKLDSPVDGRAIFVSRADGSGARRITPWKLAATEPSWSPHGPSSASAPSRR